MAGDVQKDFWLAFDLLRNPKDHAEFSIVRDWVRDTLKVSSHLPFVVLIEISLTGSFVWCLPTMCNKDLAFGLEICDR